MGAGIQMTRELSTEWSSRGVRVNAILPAQVWNEGLRKRVAAVPELLDTFLGGIPMGPLGEPEEIKGPAIFSASDASSFVTGAILPMDGGNLALNAGGSYPGSPRRTRRRCPAITFLSLRGFVPFGVEPCEFLRMNNYRQAAL